MATIDQTVETQQAATGETEALISGSEAVAVATRLADVDVLTAYPDAPEY